MNRESFHIDYARTERVGFPEVIFGESKSTEQLRGILADHVRAGRQALATRVQPEKATQLLQEFPGAFYEAESGIFLLGEHAQDLPEGEVAIVSGGTSDVFAVNEVYHTLAHFGTRATRIVDVGVSGLHRLMGHLENLKTFDILIGVAGFEAALPTVMAGLLPQPIIAVPTSVGYGVAAGGHAALNGLLASCANGICVVNIDNGYGAAVAAWRILQRIRAVADA